MESWENMFAAVAAAVMVVVVAVAMTVMVVVGQWRIAKLVLDL